MFSQEVTVVNPTGLHARPASKLTNVCQKYTSEKIRIVNGEKSFDPKSVLMLLSAGIKKGTTIRIEVEGPDEEQAGAEIVNFIQTLEE